MAQTNHLRFADDVVVTADNIKELNAMLQQLSQVSASIGLKMNHKTEIMSHEDANIYIDKKYVERVDGMFIWVTLSNWGKSTNMQKLSDV